MPRNRFNLYVPQKQASPRVKKVAREIKRILAEIFLKQDIPPIWNKNDEMVPFPGILTITDVQLSADLIECKVFVMPLANQNIEKVEPYLTLAAPVIRKCFAEKSMLRFVPNFRFYLDSSFQIAERIDKLININKQHENNHSFEQEAKE